MPGDLETIKEMFDEATIDEKSSFLFKALMALDKNMKDGFKTGNDARAEIVGKVKEGFEKVDATLQSMTVTCGNQKNVCGKKFVTKAQSRVFGLLVVVLVAGIGIGAGYITFFELFKKAIP